MKAWLVLLALALAGCSDKAGVPEGLPVDKDGKQLPTLHGFVVDEAIRPLAGVEVRLLVTGVNATTDEDGRYEILRPTRVAEAVLVTAFKDGYSPLTHQVQLSGQRSARSDFHLEADANQVAHVDVLKQTVLLGCRARVEPLGLVSCDRPNPLEPMAPPGTKQWWLNPTPGLAGVVVELHWEAQSPMAEHLHARLRAPVAGGDSGSPGTLQAEAAGGSPLRLEIGPEAAKSFARWTAVVLEVEVPSGQPSAPVGLSADQAVDAFATLFYVDPAPPGYTLA